MLSGLKNIFVCQRLFGFLGKEWEHSTQNNYIFLEMRTTSMQFYWGLYFLPSSFCCSNRILIIHIPIKLIKLIFCVCSTCIKIKFNLWFLKGFQFCILISKMLCICTYIHICICYDFYNKRDSYAYYRRDWKILSYVFSNGSKI